MNDRFAHVGIQPVPAPRLRRRKWYQGRPVASGLVLAVILLGCLCCGWFAPKDPAYMDLGNAARAPGAQFWFGTDAMGRDIFSMIWYGGRISLFIGLFASAISTGVAVLVGAVSGLAPRWLDDILMRLTEIVLSIPNLLLVVLLQAVLGKANVLSLAFVIGITGWTGIAKVVRTEVRRLRSSGYVIAAWCMGGGFWHILRKHLTPNLVSAIMFMVVMNIRGAIAAESTLSFMGIGLPLEVISWGSMLSQAERSTLSGCWWILLIPGVFLTVTLVCITDIGNHLRKSVSRGESNL